MGRKRGVTVKFSIILPVYNVEKYIKKCIDSILAQTYTDYEIVVVNDQTPDNSMQIVQEFADAYPEKFNIINQQNKGLGGARNTGVAAAKGEYIFFVDSDDYIESNALQVLHEHIEKYPCDVLEYNYMEVAPNGKVLKYLTFYDETAVVTKKEEIAKLLLGSPVAVNKVCRREFFINSGILFPEKTLYEDAVTRILVAKASSVVCCKEHLYNYVQREGSIMNGAVSPRTLDITKVVDLVYDVFAAENMLQDFGAELEAALISSLLRIAADVLKKDPAHSARQQIVEYTVRKFPNYTENPQLTKDAKMKLSCLVKGDISGYKKYDTIMNIKKFILQSALFRRLNALRKGI